MRSGEKRQILFWSWVIFTFFFFLPGSIFSASSNLPPSIPQSGDRFPWVSFFNLLSPEDQKYLGIGQKKTFNIGEIKAELILIYFMNTNCIHCIQSLPTFDEIFKTIEQQANLKAKVRIVAMGVGDTPTEVETFKKNYGVPFPILSDREYIAHKAVGEPRVPFLIIARKDRGGKWIVASAQVGLVGAMESRSILSTEEEFIVATVQGGKIFSIEHFIGELEAILATPPENLKYKRDRQS